MVVKKKDVEGDAPAEEEAAPEPKTICPQCGAENYTQQNDKADHEEFCSLRYAQDKALSLKELDANAKATADAEKEVLANTVAEDEAKARAKKK